jgi:poly-gamma-glutamate capsule biosynthesis protein CapA/YwtB (metallophosphatase superfamily)
VAETTTNEEFTIDVGDAVKRIKSEVRLAQDHFDVVFAEIHAQGCYNSIMETKFFEAYRAFNDAILELILLDAAIEDPAGRKLVLNSSAKGIDK